MKNSNPGSSDGSAAPRSNGGKANTGRDTSRDPISLALKRLHETVVAEPVPDDFLNLLAEIDRKLESEGRTE